MKAIQLTDQEFIEAQKMSRQELMQKAQGDLRYCKKDSLWESLFKKYFPDEKKKPYDNYYESFLDRFNKKLEKVKEDGWAIEFDCEAIRSDREIMLAAVTSKGCALACAIGQLRGDVSLVLTAVTQNGLSLRYALKELRKNRNIVHAAINQNGLAIMHAKDDIQDDKEMALIAVRNNNLALIYISVRLQREKEVALAAVQQDGRIFESVHKVLQEDLDIVFSAIRQSGEILESVSEKLQDNLGVVLSAIRKTGKILEHASEKLQNNLLLQEASEITNDEERIELCGQIYRDTHHLSDITSCHYHVVQYPWAFQFMTKEYKANEKLVEEILLKDGSAIEYASEEIKNQPYFAIMAVIQCPSSRRYLNNYLKDDELIKEIAAIPLLQDRIQRFNDLKKIQTTKSSMKIVKPVLSPKEEKHYSPKFKFSRNDKPYSQNQKNDEVVSCLNQLI